MKAIHVLRLSLLLAVVAISGPLEPAVADRAYLEEFRQAVSRALGTSKDQAPGVLVRYGPPDLDGSTAYDHPRPPIVVRWLAYERAGVRALFVANESLSDPPPYTWTLIGFVDIARNEAISFEEGERRLRAARALKKKRS
jgi:hypothetical protein